MIAFDYHNTLYSCPNLGLYCVICKEFIQQHMTLRLSFAIFIVRNEKYNWLMSLLLFLRVSIMMSRFLNMPEKRISAFKDFFAHTTRFLVKRCTVSSILVGITAVLLSPYRGLR